MALTRCHRQRMAAPGSLGKGLGASQGGMGKLPSEVLCSSSGHLVWPLLQMGTGWVHKCLLFLDSPLRCENTHCRVPVLPRLQQSTWGESHMLSQHRTPKRPHCGMCLVSTTVSSFSSTELSIRRATLSTSPNSSPESSEGEAPSTYPSHVTHGPWHTVSGQ